MLLSRYFGTPAVRAGDAGEEFADCYALNPHDMLIPLPRCQSIGLLGPSFSRKMLTKRLSAKFSPKNCCCCETASALTVLSLDRDERETRHCVQVDNERVIGSSVDVVARRMEAVVESFERRGLTVLRARAPLWRRGGVWCRARWAAAGHENYRVTRFRIPQPRRTELATCGARSKSKEERGK